MSPHSHSNFDATAGLLHGIEILRTYRNCWFLTYDIITVLCGDLLTLTAVFFLSIMVRIYLTVILLALNNIMAEKLVMLKMPQVFKV